MEKFHCTARELLQRASSEELSEIMGLFRLQLKEREKKHPKQSTTGDGARQGPRPPPPKTWK